MIKRWIQSNFYFVMKRRDSLETEVGFVWVIFKKGKRRKSDCGILWREDWAKVGTITLSGCYFPKATNRYFIVKYKVCNVKRIVIAKMMRSLICLMNLTIVDALLVCFFFTSATSSKKNSNDEHHFYSDSIPTSLVAVAAAHGPLSSGLSCSPHE